ncbi:PaaI family thioesterase [Nocardioides daejeonensis]|uniref:PaaI family thioesterase n=1 Tax=Nocardioides daejeonensis TaxID=1046556 RepID=UPI000D74C785|nr:PaaI family thioesterase [Nocardioides daejeonensis]
MDDEAQRAAVGELVLSTRDLMLAVGTTELPPEEVAAARAEIDALAARLGVGRRDRVLRAGFDGPAKAKANGVPWRSFAYNPMAIPFDMTFEGTTARGRLEANAIHEGPADSLHGGYAAHLMDCVLGTMMQANGYRAVTGTLEIRYVRRTPLDQPLELFGEIVRSAGRKHTARGWISHDGEPTVEATGLFVEVAR